MRTGDIGITMDIPVSVRPLFVAAGWHAGRRVPVDGRVPARHPAHAVLQEMGGLHVGRTEGGGIECSRSDLQFGFCDDCAGDGIVSTLQTVLPSRLIGVAEVHNCHEWLLLDEAGRGFGASVVHDGFHFVGQTFAQAAERELLGRKARPMLRPDQQEVRLYGMTFRRGHPAIFDPEA